MNSKILTPLNKIWFRFGILLGSFVSPIVMGLVFFAIVTPTALIMRVLGKNLLNLKRDTKNDLVNVLIVEFNNKIWLEQCLSTLKRY